MLRLHALVVEKYTYPRVDMEISTEILAYDISKHQRKSKVHRYQLILPNVISFLKYNFATTTT